MGFKCLSGLFFSGKRGGLRAEADGVEDIGKPVHAQGETGTFGGVFYGSSLHLSFEIPEQNGHFAPSERGLLNETHYTKRRKPDNERMAAQHFALVGSIGHVDAHLEEFPSPGLLLLLQHLDLAQQVVGLRCQCAFVWCLYNVE